MSERSEPPIDAIQPQNTTGTKNPEAPHNPPSSSEIPPTPQNRKETYTCRPDQTPWWKYLLEGCAIVVGLYVALVYSRQLEVMRGTLAEMKRSGEQSTQQVWRAVDNLNWMARSMDWSQKTAQQSIQASGKESSDALKATIDNFHREERSWVGVGSFKIVPNPAEGGKAYSAIAETTLLNSGRVPAQNIEIFEGFGEKNSRHMLDAADEKWMQEELSMFSKGTMRPERRNEEMPGWVPPFYSVHSDILGNADFSKTEFGSLIPGAPRVFANQSINWAVQGGRDPNEPVIFGLILYSDNYARERRTTFCIFRSDPRVNDLAFCPIFNKSN
jgi:hypothetical protein